MLVWSMRVGDAGDRYVSVVYAGDGYVSVVNG